VLLPSVLWRCWLGSRKGIRPVKNWVVGCWHGNLYGARCRLAYGPACVTFFSEIQIGLPFWYRLTRVVLEKRAVKRVCVCCYDHQISTATVVVGYDRSNTVTAVFYSVLSSLPGYGFPKSCPSLFRFLTARELISLTVSQWWQMRPEFSVKVS